MTKSVTIKPCSIWFHRNFTKLDFVLPTFSVQFLHVPSFPIILLELYFYKQIRTTFRYQGILQRYLSLERVLITISIISVYEGIVYGFFHRWTFTLITNILAFYPFICGVRELSVNILWIITSVLLSTFTLFDAVKIEDLNQIHLAGLLIILSAFYALYKIHSRINSYTRAIFAIQISLVAAMLAVTHRSVISLQLRQGLPRESQVAGWIIFLYLFL